MANKHTVPAPIEQARDTDVDLVALRDHMLARKGELTQQAKVGDLPNAELRVLHVA